MKSKKLIGITLIGMTLASSMFPAFAEYNPNKVVTGPITTLRLPQDSFGGLHMNLVINDKGLNPQDTKVYMKENGVTMIPLRLISETLGYEVKWDSKKKIIELIKGPQWIMIKAEEDQYTFGKMAPVTLGTIPEIKNGRTYIPLKFVTDILRLEVMRDETGTIHIKDKRMAIEKSVLYTDGKIAEIQKINDNTRILIEVIKKGKGYESIILNITEDTKIQNPVNNKEISVEDLKEGDTIRAFYGPAVTRSLPPIGKAEKIQVLKSTAVLDGKITDIRMNDKSTKILVGSMTDGVMLIINDETKIVTEEDKEISIDDLQKGMEITAYHDLVMTMSIPGMTGAKKIVVKE
ncbi:copper amine oxidase N-terminal domain-containing protein [Crassaminicella profunda]|uniref:copper amine oxidase N-terminal domain-containing protein n=1 Tax=Crassaminicella profunda TaxID=1286698 RepID=UPI001CA731F0|nr:copper amine oxidase N-terminal domain-containing protein [Crassaminicella profunda]QZY54555.1 copper amine oxidase N-terminal domain-containing protein [Crassaminicella profunda]